MKLYTFIIRPMVFIALLSFIFNTNIYAQSSLNIGDSYTEALFSLGLLNTIQIDVSDSTWQSMKRDAVQKMDYKCSVTINGEIFKNASIRTKGASSLNAVVQMGSDRFSFMITPKFRTTLI